MKTDLVKSIEKKLSKASPLVEELYGTYNLEGCGLSVLCNISMGIDLLNHIEENFSQRESRYIFKSRMEKLEDET